MNSHLDAIDAAILAETQAARNTITGLCVGDLVIWPNGESRRVSDMTWDHVAQTSKVRKGSWHVFKNGRSSFSGSLQPPQLREHFHKTEDRSFESFWFFHHDRAGEGRSVQVRLEVAVWRLVPVEMTREQAVSHPYAVKSLEIWGNPENPDYLRRITELMRPPVMDNPDYF